MPVESKVVLSLNNNSCVLHSFLLTEESPPKSPKVTSLASASVGGAPISRRLKPSYYIKKPKHKDDVNIRSPSLRLIQ